MSAYTKGPWEIATYRNYFGFSVWSAHGPCIAELWYQHERTPQQDEEMMANARLIIAAPELLEALRKSEAFIEEELNVRKQSFLPEGSPYIDGAQAVLDLVSAAIAKAGGK